MTAIRSLLLATIAASSLIAQTRIWVDPVNGSNSNPGTAALPMQTLSAALPGAASNDEIMLLPGLYGATNGEVFPITIGNGVVQNNMVIRGTGGVVFDMQASGSTVLRLASGATGLRITNITFFNTDQTQWWTRVINSGHGVDTANSAMNVEIDRCRFINVNRAFVLWTADNCTGWKVHDNLFANLTNDAILEYTGTNQFYNNTFHTNLWKAYISDSAASLCYNNLIVSNNIAFECNNANQNPARFQNNWIYQCTTVATGSGLNPGMLPATNIVGIDPQMVAPGSSDFHLQATSPCIDVGDPTLFARMDLDGVSRFVDADQNGSVLPDIGCYEVSPLSMTATFDPSIGVLITAWNRTAPNIAGFVLFAFDDGLVTIPGNSQILVSPTSYIGYVWSPAPTNWYINLNPALPFLPGTRIVNHVIGIGSGPSILGGNQTWTQF